MALIVTCRYYRTLSHTKIILFGLLNNLLLRDMFLVRIDLLD